MNFNVKEQVTWSPIAFSQIYFIAFLQKKKKTHYSPFLRKKNKKNNDISDEIGPINRIMTKQMYLIYIGLLIVSAVC